MEDDKERMKYFENMSRAFASMAVDSVATLHRDINKAPVRSIWGRVERKELITGGKVNAVRAFRFSCNSTLGGLRHG
jgi:hypothetical protein